jgi:hypothetical protein
VTNSDSVISLAKEYSNKYRIFPLGIGKDVNRHLLTGLALNSNAHSEILLDHPSVNAAVAKILHHVDENCYIKAAMRINDREVGGHEAVQSNNFNLFVYKSHQSDRVVKTVGVTYYHGLTEQSDFFTHYNADRTIYDYYNLMKVELLRSWHAERILQRLDKDNHHHQNTKYIIDLSISYRIMNERTSFVLKGGKKKELGRTKPET